MYRVFPPFNRLKKNIKNKIKKKPTIMTSKQGLSVKNHRPNADLLFD